MTNTVWKQEEINFLKENYPKFGAKFCSEKLERSVGAIHTKSYLLKIKPSKETLKRINTQVQLKYNDERPNSDFNINIEQFLDIQKPEVAYFLGFVWADGYIVRQELRLSILEDDMNIIKPTLNKIGKWNYNLRVRNGGRPICSAITNNRKLFKFLENNDYKIKSGASADKILRKIPEHLKHYFFRGLVDGDGHIGKDKISISSNYEQDWNYVTNITKALTIDSYIYRNVVNSKSKYSVVEINGKNSLIFGNYIYQNIEIDKIGLNRKFESYINLKHNVENGRNYIANEKKMKSLEMFTQGMSIPKIMDTFKIASTTVRRYLKEFESYEEIQNNIRITEKDVLNIRKQYEFNKNIKELHKFYHSKIGLYGFRKICYGYSWKHLN